MFPLGTALVPFQVLPLQVFEPRYRTLVERCLATDRRFGVVLIERGSEVGGGDVRFEIGTVARITDHAEAADGRLLLATIGEHRVKVTEWLTDEPYPLADVQVMTDPSLRSDGADQRAEIGAAFDRIVDLARALGAVVPNDVRLSDDPVRAGWEATARAPIGPLDVLGILREDSPDARLDRVVVALRDAAELLELQLGERR